MNFVVDYVESGFIIEVFCCVGIDDYKWKEICILVEFVDVCDV